MDGVKENKKIETFDRIESGKTVRTSHSSRTNLLDMDAVRY